MKNISDKINEALYAELFTVGAGTDEDDLLTREYGNLYGMFSNTLLRKTPFDCYVLTGSSLRSGSDFLTTSHFNVNDATAFDWFVEHALNLYKPNGECISSCEEDDTLDLELLSNISNYVKDKDYLIVR